MELIADIIAILQIVTFIVAVSFGLYLIATSTQKRPSTYIGLFLIVFTTDTILALLVNHGITVGREYLFFLPVAFWFLSPAFLYIYTRKLTRPLRRPTELLLMLPGFVEFTVLFTLLIFGYTGLLDMADTSMWIGGLIQYYNLSVLYTFVYYVVIILTVRKTRRALDSEFSNVHGLELKWLEIICYMSIITMLSWVGMTMIGDHEIESKLKLIVYVFNMVTIGYIIFSAFTQHSLGLDQTINISKITLEPTLQKLSSADIASQAIAEFEIVSKAMEDGKAYLNPNLKIHDIAHLTNFSIRRISSIILSGAGLNFRGFVNAYRVDEAKRLLASDKIKHLSMDGIAKESGFSSRSTFYQTFKSLIGCSPKEYAKSLRD